MPFLLKGRGQGRTSFSMVARPYRAYLCPGKTTSVDEATSVLCHEVERYNNHQVHSTTGENPNLRFENARKAGASLFRPYSLPKPYTSPKDVFSLRDRRLMNGYH